MRTKTLLLTLFVATLTGCELSDDFFDWLDGATIVCNDVQSQADACWAGADDESAQTECETLDWEAAQCTWQSSGSATEAAATVDTGALVDDPCASLEDYADACWELAEDADDEGYCEEVELDLADCLDAEED